MAESIQDTLDRLTAFVSQNYTDVETGPGSVISELLLKLASVVQNAQYNKIDTLSQGAAISNIMSSATDTYSEVMDLIASNYNTARSTGTKVTGKIKVTVSDSNKYNFRSGFTFVQPSLNLNYVLADNVRVSPNPSATLQELQLYSNNGLYYFILPVVAELAGPAYQVSANTVFNLGADESISDFVKAEAYGNFSSGKAVETDKELVAKIKSNLGNGRLESPAGITNRFSSMFSGFQSLSVCGANDDEMTRSKQNLLGISTFGKADVYVRTSVGPETLQFKKMAKKKADNLWEMDIAATDAPGFYTIKSIIPVTPNVNLGGTLLPTSVSYDYVQYPGRNNELSSKSDARFTKYQTAKVLFTYVDVPAMPVDSLAEFEVHAIYQPNILEMQDMLLLDGERLACADYLVKAVIPCMVSLNINLLRKRATDTFDTLNLQQLKKDIFTYVNTIPFGGDLHASNIVDICHNYDIRRVDLPITMTGVILCPDGSTITISDSDVLTIPYNLAKGVTPKTASYFIDYYRVENGVTNPIDNIGLNIA
jgi:hypothetical protein